MASPDILLTIVITVIFVWNVQRIVTQLFKVPRLDVPKWEK